MLIFRKDPIFRFIVGYFFGTAVSQREDYVSLRWNGTCRAKGKDRTYLRDDTRWKAFYRLTYIVNCLKRRPGALRTNLNSKPPRYIDIRIAGKMPDRVFDKEKKILLNKSRFVHFHRFSVPYTRDIRPT